MIKKVFFIVICCIFLLFTGCVAPAGSGTPAATPVQVVSDRLTVVESNYVKRDEFNAFGTRLVAVEARPSSSSDGYSKGETYTRNEIENKITALNSTISALETRIKALESGGSSGGSSGGGSTPTPTNQVVVKTYSMTPSMIYGGGNYDLFVEVKNGYADSKKIVLTVTLTPDQANTKIQAYPNTKFFSDSAYITGSGDKMATNVSAGDCVNLTNLVMGTTNQIFIGGNSSVLIPVKLLLTYCGGSITAIWTPTWSATVIP